MIKTSCIIILCLKKWFESIFFLKIEEGILTFVAFRTTNFKSSNSMLDELRFSFFYKCKNFDFLVKLSQHHSSLSSFFCDFNWKWCFQRMFTDKQIQSLNWNKSNTNINNNCQIKSTWKAKSNYSKNMISPWATKNNDIS